MGEDEADQQRLLLARRGGAGRDVLRAVADERGRRPAGRRACGRRRGRGRGRRAGWRGSGPPRRRPAARRQARRSRPRAPASAKGKGEASSRVARIRRGEALHGLAPRGRDRDREFRHLALDRVEPERVVGAVLEHAVARAQRPLQRVRRARRARHRRRARAGRGSGGGRRPGRETARRGRASARRRADARRRPRASATGAPSMRQRAPRGASARPVRGRCRGGARRTPCRAQARSRSRPARRCGPCRRARPGAGRGPARTATGLRADWSCRRRSRPTSAHEAACATREIEGRGRSGNPEARGGATRMAASTPDLDAAQAWRMRGHTRIGIRT